MRCIDAIGWRVALSVLLAALVGCGSAAWPTPGAVAPPAPVSAVAPAAQVGRAALARPSAARDWEAFKRQAAERLVSASPGQTYGGEPPAELFAIPVLEVELARDGTVRRVVILRRPSNPAAQDTVRMAVDAVHRAAPYGDMSALARPWIWTEVFLFDAQRRFKPRTLDE